MQPNTGTKRVKFEECKAGHRKDDVIMCVNGLQEDGALGGIRTHDPCLRRAILYPAELRVRAAAMIRICSTFVHANAR